jgi:hypothetical protein
MSERVLLGPFLTRAQAACIAGVSPDAILHRPDLLRVSGRRLPETYFAFQFDELGIKRNVGLVVVALRGRFDDLAIADWLVRPNTALDGAIPLTWLKGGGDYRHVIEVAEVAGPVAGEEAEPEPFREPLKETRPAPHPPVRHRRRKAKGFRPLGSH